MLALRHLGQARGIAKVAKAAGIERESLYRALSRRGNPRLSTLVAVTKAIGLKLTVEAAADTDAPDSGNQEEKSNPRPGYQKPEPGASGVKGGWVTSRLSPSSSLSLDYLKKLGHLFRVETGYEDEKVGGNDQIAAIRKDSDVELDIHGNLDRIKNQAPFTVWICKPGASIRGMAAGVGIVSDIPIIFESCTFITMDLILDGNVYMHCTFRDSKLSYWGSDNTLFEDDNTVEGNSFLRRGPTSCRHPEVAEKLAKRFDFQHGGTAYNGPGNKPEACPPLALPAAPSSGSQDRPQ